MEWRGIPKSLNSITQFVAHLRLLYTCSLEEKLWPTFSSVQSLNHIWLCKPMDCSTPVFPVHHQLTDITQTHVHQVSDAIQQYCPLSSPFPAFHLSQHQGLCQWVSSSHQVAKVLFSFSISPSNEYSGLISFRIDRLDLLAVQGTLKSSPTQQF